MRTLKYVLCAAFLLVGLLMVVNGTQFLLSSESCSSNAVCIEPWVQSSLFTVWQICAGFTHIAFAFALVREIETGKGGMLLVCLGLDIAEVGVLLLMLPYLNKFDISSNDTRLPALVLMLLGIGLTTVPLFKKES